MQNIMLNTKSILRSRTVWGASVAAIAGVAGLLGYPVSAADQAEAVGLIGRVAEEWDRLAVIGGSAVAIWGRVAATRRLV